MQVILLEKVVNLGNLGDVVKVKDGYARNFLIPTKAARRATEAAIKEFEAKRAELEKAAADKLAAAQALGEKMNGRTVHITQKAGVDGRLFGSVTNADIADALTRIDFKVAKAQVRMPNGPLKTVGEHVVTVVPHTDVVGGNQGCRDRRNGLRYASRPSKGRHKPAFVIGAQVFHLFPPDRHRLSTGLPTSMSKVYESPEPSAPARDDEVARLRVPPHSIEAEQSVLGGLLLDNSAWDRAGDLLTDSDFYRYEHRHIYAAIGALVNATRPADVITVFEQLQSLGKAEECGGLVYLNALAQSVPSAANLRRYAEIVRERAVLRKLVATSDEIATAAFNPQGRPVSRDPRRGRGQDLPHRRGRLAFASRASRAWTSWSCS